MSKTDKDNPEWTRAMFRKAKPAREVFAGRDLPAPKRGPQKSPTKIQTTIRLDREIVEHFKKRGEGWQTRLNQALRQVIESQRKRRA
jgi:uncharacterized protein (DUF4415 family)